MDELFKYVNVSGIIKPGDCYVLTSDPARGQDIILNLSYLLRKDEDIVPALKMHCIVVGQWQELLEFQNWERVSRDCYVFVMRCFDKDKEQEIIDRLYLHRLPELAEGLAEIREEFCANIKIDE
jgi:hypothetical protein